MFVFLAITALAAEPLGLTIDLGQDVVLIDGREQLTGHVIYDDGSVRTVEEPMEWTSSAPDVLEITPDGVAAGLQVGFTEVSATWSGIRSLPLVVEVVDLEPKRLHLEPVAVELLPGSTTDLRLIATFDDGRQANATRQATWLTRYRSVASVDHGQVTAHLEGKTLVTASYRGTRAPSAEVKIHIPEALGLIVDPPVSMMVTGSRINLSAKAVFPDGHSLDVSDRVSWKSNAPDVVVVDAVGRITALRTGRAQIFTRWNALSIAPIGIEVVAGTVEALRFEGDVRTVAADEVLHMTVEGLVAGQWIDLTHAVSWISSDHQVLLAEDSGLVTGVARGRTSLTARYGPVAASVDIVVIP